MAALVGFGLWFWVAVCDCGFLFVGLGGWMSLGFGIWVWVLISDAIGWFAVMLVRFVFWIIGLAGLVLALCGPLGLVVGSLVCFVVCLFSFAFCFGVCCDALGCSLCWCLDYGGVCLCWFDWLVILSVLISLFDWLTFSGFYLVGSHG